MNEQRQQELNVCTGTRTRQILQLCFCTTKLPISQASSCTERHCEPLPTYHFREELHPPDKQEGTGTQLVTSHLINRCGSGDKFENTNYMLTEGKPRLGAPV